ncbi:MAG: OmpA family protein [Alphaproteobacteria bacterium]|nr:MAG: OmpA family protein [Alphaproteobacteria bacterium]
MPLGKIVNSIKAIESKGLAMSRTLWRISVCMLLAAVFLHLQTNSALAFGDSGVSYQIKPQNAASQQNSPAVNNIAANKPMSAPPSANAPAWYNKAQNFFRNEGEPVPVSAATPLPPVKTAAPAAISEPAKAAIPGFAPPKFSEYAPPAQNTPNWNPITPPAQKPQAAAPNNAFSSMPLTPPSDYNANAQNNNAGPSLSASTAPALNPASQQDYFNQSQKRAAGAPVEQPLRAPAQTAPMNSYPNLSSVPMQPLQDQSSGEWARKLQADHAAAQQAMQQDWAQPSNDYIQEFPMVPQQALAPSPAEMPAATPNWSQTAVPVPQKMATPVTQQNVDSYRAAQPVRSESPQASNAPTVHNADTQNWPKTPLYVMENNSGFDNNTPLVPPTTPYSQNSYQGANDLAWNEVPPATTPVAPSASMQQQATSQQPSIISYGNVYITTGDSYQRNAQPDAPVTAQQNWTAPAAAPASNAAAMTPATPYLNPRDLSLMMTAEGTPAPAMAQPSWVGDSYYNSANNLQGMPLQPPSNAFAQQPIAASPFAGYQPSVTNMAEMAPMNMPAPFVPPVQQGNYYSWSDMTGQGGLVPPAEITGATPWSYNGGAMQAYTDRMMQSAPYTSGTGAPYYPYGYSGFGNWQGARSPYRTQVASNTASIPSGTGQYPTPIGAFDTNKPVATIYFHGDNSNLGAEENKVLKQLTDWFQGKGGGLKVVGHSSARTADMDPDKQKQRNYKLSLDRADNVAKRLQKLGVPKDRVIVSAHGDTEKAYSESMPSGEAWNRRVEIYWDMF